MNLIEELKSKSVVSGIIIFFVGVTVGIGLIEKLRVEPLNSELNEYKFKIDQLNQGAEQLPVDIETLKNPDGEKGILSLVSKKVEHSNISGPVFRNSSPFPLGFEAAKIGTPVSVLRTLFSSRKTKLTSGYFSVDLETGPFRSVAFYFSAREQDSKVKFIHFWFRNEKAKEYVRKQALTVFHAYPYKSAVMGKVIEWKNIKGYQVIMDDSYEIKISEK